MPDFADRVMLFGRRSGLLLSGAAADQPPWRSPALTDARNPCPEQVRPVFGACMPESEAEPGLKRAHRLAFTAARTLPTLDFTSEHSDAKLRDLREERNWICGPLSYSQSRVLDHAENSNLTVMCLPDD